MSDPVTVIPVQQLRQAFELLIGYVESTAGPSLVVHGDPFWAIPQESRYDVYSEPRELTIGSVSESWSSLKDMIDHEDRVVGYGLIWLADVLRAIGDEMAL